MLDTNGNLIACVVAVPLSSTEAKIRQMAVDVKHQGKGNGRSIILGIETYLAQLGYIHLSLHARISAVGFYEKFGYTKAGEEFMEIGIPHVKMEKSVQTSRADIAEKAGGLKIDAFRFL